MVNAAPFPPHRRSVCWRCLLLSYAFLALFLVASNLVTQMNAPLLGASTLTLSLPTMAALWHQGTVRRLIALHQFQPGRALHRWGSRRALGILFRAAVAIVLTATTLLQSVFFNPVDWVLLCLAPAIYQAVRAIIEATTGPQFSDRVYAQRWSTWATQCMVVAVLTGASVGARYVSAEEPTQPYVDRIYELQSDWAQVPSGTVKWALDAGAWGQAATEALGHPREDARTSASRSEVAIASREGPEAANSGAIWRLLLALVIAPVSVFSYLALSLAGLSLPVAEVRRTLGERLTTDESPPPVGPVRTAVWAAVAVICVMSLFKLIDAMDSRLRAQDSPFAVMPLPECERIGGKVYKLNTSHLLESLMIEVKGALGTSQGVACEKLSAVEKLAEPGVVAYLDWYFSLGAEWSRLATMFTGDVDLLLQAKFNQVVLSNPEVGSLLTGVQAEYEQQWNQLIVARSGAVELLEQNRLVLSEAQCKVVKDLAANPWIPQLDGFKARLVTGSGAGLVAGALAAKVAAKAMSKFSMKLAAKVLAKAVAKKGIGMAGGATIGWFFGGPFGAVIGAGLGLAVGVGVDIAALAAEEKLTRADMKRDLLSAVAESLQPYRDTFECK